MSYQLPDDDDGPFRVQAHGENAMISNHDTAQPIKQNVSPNTGFNKNKD